MSDMHPIFEGDVVIVRSLNG
ncbi:hypothetical protein LCGC14_3152370, partial [marine sediment metagenome]